MSSPVLRPYEGNPSTNPSNQIAPGASGLEGILGEILALLKGGNAIIRPPQPGVRGSDRTVIERESFNEYMMALNPHTMTTGAFVWSPLLFVGQYDQIVVNLSLTAAGTGANVVTQLAVVWVDIVNVNIAGTWSDANIQAAIRHLYSTWDSVNGGGGGVSPYSATPAASPAAGTSLITAAFQKPFGAAIICGVQIASNYTTPNGSNLIVTVDGK